MKFKKILAAISIITMLGQASAALAQETTVAKGENQIVQTEIETDDLNLLEFFGSTVEDFSVINFEAFEAEYVSEDGKTTIWYCSYLKEIDGLVRTGKTRPRGGEPYDIFAKTSEEYSFKGDYVHLYANEEEGLFRPIKSTKMVEFINGVEFSRTCFITAISDEALELLNNFNVYRVIDNFFVLDYAIASIKNEGYAGLAILEPIEATKDSLTIKLDALTDTENLYDEKFNGYLLSFSYAKAPYSILTASEEEKIMKFTLVPNK